ncbi:MAG: hypothetical protein JO066_04505 [Verrucomicrobia bacterium]|nr:hypothetical protein [Verrucomicrobiota bacterium]
MDSRLSPFEGSRVAVVVLDELIDGMGQLSNTGEVGSLQGLVAQNTKPNLDLIEPQGVGGVK